MPIRRKRHDDFSASLHTDDPVRMTAASIDTTAATSTEVPLPRRIAMVLATMTIATVFYLAINTYPLREPRLLPLTFIDEWIGWQAWTIWPYWLLLFTGPALLLSIRERGLLLATLRAYAIAMSLNAAIWLAWPTRMLRSGLPEGMNPFTAFAWHCLYALDDVNNCFPSGHITIPAVVAVGAGLQYPRARPWIWLTLIALAPSVISTGQHYAWDIAGGLVTATIGLLLAGVPLWRPGAAPLLQPQ